MSVPCEFLALVREHILGHHRDNPALTTSERSLYGSTTCTYGELLDRAVELKETLICLAGEAQPDGSPNNEAASNVVICGDSALHAVATLACSFAGFVAVYIPYEATIGETVSRALAVQRASQASAIVFNDQVWRDFKEQMMKRDTPHANIVVYKHASGHSQVVYDIVPSPPPSPAPTAASRSPRSSAHPPTTFPTAESPSASQPASMIFHRRGRHAAVAFSWASIQSHICSGMGPLLHAIDPINGGAISRLACHLSTKTSRHIGSVGHLLTNPASHSSSIRASHTGSSSGPSGHDRPGPCSHFSSGSFAYPDDDTVSPALPKMQCASRSGLPGTSTPERKVEQHLAGTASVASGAIAPGATESEVIPACPAALSPSPIVVQGCVLPSGQPPPESPVSLLAPHLHLDDGSAFVDTTAPEILASSSAATRKADALACAFPADTPGQRTCSVIPSELHQYSGTPPASGRCVPGREVSPEPHTGAVQAPHWLSSDVPLPHELYATTVTEHLSTREARVCAAAVRSLRSHRLSPAEEALMAPARTSSYTHEPSEENDAHWQAPWEVEASSSDAEEEAASVAETPRARGGLDSLGSKASLHLVPPLLLPDHLNGSECASPYMCEISPCIAGVRGDDVECGVLSERKRVGSVAPALNLPEGLGESTARSSTRRRQPPIGVSPCVCEINPWDDDDEDHGGLQSEASSEESYGGPVLGGGPSFGDQSLPWRENAWTGSPWGRPEGGGSCFSGSSWQPRVLCALPTAAPAGLLFGLLTPLLLGWHIVLENPGFCPGTPGESIEGAWLALQEHGAALDGLLLTAAHCDVLTRCAMEESAAREGPWSKASVSSLSLAALRACAVFGPCLTPPVSQSFLAALQPHGLRRSCMSVVCSTWDLPCVCPPLLGLHTMAAGVRCAAGTHDSTFSTVCIVDSRSRTVLPDGSIGNVWVAMAAEHLPSARGPGIAPLQWTFHPDTRTRQGPFRVSGLAGYISEGRLFIVGRVVDILFTSDASHHVSDLEAFLAGVSPCLPHRDFALILPPAAPQSDTPAPVMFLRDDIAGFKNLPELRTVASKGAGGARWPGKWTAPLLRRLSTTPTWLVGRALAPARTVQRALSSWSNDSRSFRNVLPIDSLVSSAQASSAGRPACSRQNGPGMEGSADGRPTQAVLVVRRSGSGSKGKGCGGSDWTIGIKPRRSLPSRLTSCLSCSGGTGAVDEGGLGEDGIGRSLEMLKLKYGVEVSEIWNVDGGLPVTPMGSTDRSAASSMQVRVGVCNVAGAGIVFP